MRFAKFLELDLLCSLLYVSVVLVGVICGCDVVDMIKF